MLISTTECNGFVCTQVNTINICEHERPNPASLLTWLVWMFTTNTRMVLLLPQAHLHLHIFWWALSLPNNHHQIIGLAFTSVLGWELGLCACGSPPEFNFSCELHTHAPKESINMTQQELGKEFNKKAEQLCWWGNSCVQKSILTEGARWSLLCCLCGEQDFRTVKSCWNDTTLFYISISILLSLTCCTPPNSIFSFHLFFGDKIRCKSSWVKIRKDT